MSSQQEEHGKNHKRRRMGHSSNDGSGVAATSGTVVAFARMVTPSAKHKRTIGQDTTTDGLVASGKKRKTVQVLPTSIPKSDSSQKAAKSPKAFTDKVMDPPPTFATPLEKMTRNGARYVTPTRPVGNAATITHVQNKKVPVPPVLVPVPPVRVPVRVRQANIKDVAPLVGNADTRKRKRDTCASVALAVVAIVTTSGIRSIYDSAVVPVLRVANTRKQPFLHFDKDTFQPSKYHGYRPMRHEIRARARARASTQAKALETDKTRKKRRIGGSGKMQERVVANSTKSSPLLAVRQVGGKIRTGITKVARIVSRKNVNALSKHFREWANLRVNALKAAPSILRETTDDGKIEAFALSEAWMEF